MKIDFIKFVQQIVKEASDLKNKYTGEVDAPVQYAAIFCHSEAEFESFVEEAEKSGKLIKATETGPIYRIKQINTASGNLEIIKIRKPDKSRPEKGDADFVASNFAFLKEECSSKNNFSLIDRKEYEMVEIVDRDFDVRVYFSYPLLDF